MNAKINTGEWTTTDAYSLLHRWEEVKSANRDFLCRLKRNFQYYSALQTPDTIKNIWLQELSQLGIDPKNYNLVQMYVDGHAGNGETRSQLLGRRCEWTATGLQFSVPGILRERLGFFWFGC